MTTRYFAGGIPAAPPPKLPDVGTRPGNPFLDWLDLADSDGGKIANYKLILEPHFYDVLHRVCYAGATELFYTLFLISSAYGAALIQWILTPNQWLTPLADFYHELTAKVYAVVPPTAIMLVTFCALVLSVFLNRTGTSAAGMPPQMRTGGEPGLLSQWMPSNTQISKAQWQRLSSGLVLMGVVVVLATNPFEIISEVMNDIMAVASDLTFTNGAGGAGAYTISNTANMLRSVSFLINYRAVLSPECAQSWSWLINLGGGNPSCLTPAQSAATDPDIVTVLLAFAAIPIGWAFLKFAGVLALKFFNHFSLTIFYALLLAWIAAASLARRRPYDPLGRCAARAAANAGLATLFYFIGSAGPALLIELSTSALSFLPAVLQVLVAAAGYYLSANLILAASENLESLFSLFHDRINKSDILNNLYAQSGTGPAQHTAWSTITSGVWTNPWSWTKHRYHRAREQAGVRWSQTPNQPNQQPQGGAVPTNIIADTPESEARTSRFQLYEGPSEDPITIDPDHRATRSDLGTVLDQDNQAIPVSSPVVAAKTGTDVVPARHAGIESTPTPGQVSEPPVVWFRSGIPQLAPPSPQYSAPPSLLPAVAEPITPPSPATPSTPTAPQHAGLAAYRGSIDELARRLRSEAALLHGAPTGQPRTVDAVVALSTAGYGGYDTPPSAAAPRPRRPKVPDLRSVLAAAQWTHQFSHNRNVLLARGVEAPLKLSDEDEATQRIVFATDASGRNKVEAINDRGFGEFV